MTTEQDSTRSEKLYFYLSKLETHFNSKDFKKFQSYLEDIAKEMEQNPDEKVFEQVFKLVENEISTTKGLEDVDAKVKHITSILGDKLIVFTKVALSDVFHDHAMKLAKNNDAFGSLNAVVKALSFFPENYSNAQLATSEVKLLHIVCEDILKIINTHLTNNEFEKMQSAAETVINTVNAAKVANYVDLRPFFANIGLALHKQDKHLNAIENVAHYFKTSSTEQLAKAENDVANLFKVIAFSLDNLMKDPNFDNKVLIKLHTLLARSLPEEHVTAQKILGFMEAKISSFVPSPAPVVTEETPVAPVVTEETPADSTVVVTSTDASSVPAVDPAVVATPAVTSTDASSVPAADPTVVPASAQTDASAATPTVDPIVVSTDTSAATPTVDPIVVSTDTSASAPAVDPAAVVTPAVVATTPAVDPAVVSTPAVTSTDTSASTPAVDPTVVATPDASAAGTTVTSTDTSASTPAVDPAIVATPDASAAGTTVTSTDASASTPAVDPTVVPQLVTEEVPMPGLVMNETAH